MIAKILSQLKLIRDQLDYIEASNIPEHIKKDKLKVLNEELDAINHSIDNNP